MIDIVIIGGGVAGLTAGIYAGRANVSVTIIEQNYIGGTTVSLVDIKNYPGYMNVNGSDLVQTMQMQCMQFGVNFEFGTIKNIDFDKNTIYMLTGEEIEYKTLIIASGTSANKLGAINEDKYRFKGLSYCAVCDGNLYKNKKLIVFTDNYSASSAIDYLYNISKDIVVCDISNKYKNDKVKVLSNVKPCEIIGKENVCGIEINTDGRNENLECDGIFVELGKSSNLDLYKDYVNIENNQIVSDADMHTNLSNVFVAGDVRYKSLKQIITACSDGAIAGTQAVKYLSENNLMSK